MRISKVFTIKERVGIQPMVEIFNLFNIANFDPPGNRLGSLLSGTSGTIMAQLRQTEPNATDWDQDQGARDN